MAGSDSTPVRGPSAGGGEGHRRAAQEMARSIESFQGTMLEVVRTDGEAEIGGVTVDVAKRALGLPLAGVRLADERLEDEVSDLDTPIESEMAIPVGDRGTRNGSATVVIRAASGRRRNADEEHA